GSFSPGLLAIGLWLEPESCHLRFTSQKPRANGQEPLFRTLLFLSPAVPWSASSAAECRRGRSTPSRRSRHRWCGLRKSRIRCRRAEYAAATGPANTTPSERFHFRSAGRKREL